MPRSGRHGRAAGRGNRPAASMRPGQSCPGVVRGIIDGIARDVGFNEAGAIMPRSGLRFRDRTESRLAKLQ